MKLIRKMRLVRPADSFLPLAFLAACLFIKDQIIILMLAGALLAVRLAALSSCTALRAAFATQPSIRKVRGSVKAALLMQLLGGGIVAAASLAIMGGGWSGEHVPLFILGGVLLNIEHCFYEYLHATGDGRSASLARAITAVLVFAGIMMTGPDGMEWWIVGSTALAALVSAVIGLSIGGALKGGLNPQVLRCAPRELLCTAAPLLLLLTPWKTETFAHVFAGWTLYELCRTPFRRSTMESRTMNRVLLVTFLACAALFGILRIWSVQTSLQNLLPRRDLYYDIIATLFALAMSAALSFILFGSVRRRDEA